MRKVVIAAAMVAGLVLVGFGVKYGWNLMRHSVTDASIDTHMPNGKMDAAMRDSFLKSFVAACSSPVPTGVDPEKFKQACVCISEKAADLVTPEEAKAANDFGTMPDAFGAKLQGPMKECARSVGLAPPQ